MRVLASAMFITHRWPELFGDNPQPVIGVMGFSGINLDVNMLWIAGVIVVFAGGSVAVGLFTPLHDSAGGNIDGNGIPGGSSCFAMQPMHQPLCIQRHITQQQPTDRFRRHRGFQ
jgi:hypothetical protein